MDVCDFNGKTLNKRNWGEEEGERRKNLQSLTLVNLTLSPALSKTLQLEY